MTKVKTGLLLASCVLALSACGRRRPETLPPAPVAGPVAEAPPAGQFDGAAAGGVVPGSDADFRRSVTSNTVLFGLDQSDIDPAARAILDTQAEWLQRNPQVRVTVEGHCDERGTREYNLALGDRRANSAKNYLAARGIAAGRMNVISYGSERPVEPGSDEGAYAANRRAVTVVIG